MKREKRDNIVLSFCAAAVAASVFGFFFWLYPYHLMHREQISLFLCDSEFISGYFDTPGGLSALCGDYLTQYFYYIGGGPVILALLIGSLWASSAYALRHIFSHKAAVALATLFTLWAFLKECGHASRLADTFALLIPCVLFFGYTLVKRRGLRLVCGILMCVFCYWASGFGVWVFLALVIGYEVKQKNILFGGIYALLGAASALLPMQPANWSLKADFALERILAVDSEVYFNNWAKVKALTSNPTTPLETYYHNLAAAHSGEFPDSLLFNPRFGIESLFIPVRPESNYLMINAASELWFRAGDMTMAEHAAMLGMIFSPSSKGTRYLRRLAEINLVNGDDEAALKYLRMLANTSCHRQWALQRMPGRQTAQIKGYYDTKSRFVASSDTLRLAQDPVTGLRTLLAANSSNQMAYAYLLTYHLLVKNLAAFKSDFNRAAPHSRLYDEGLLMALSATGASPAEAASYGIPSATLADYAEYLRLYDKTGADSAAMRRRFGHSYWYYYHFLK